MIHPNLTGCRRARVSNQAHGPRTVTVSVRDVPASSPGHKRRSPESDVVLLSGRRYISPLSNICDHLHQTLKQQAKMVSNVPEGARKAVERLFAVLFSRWHVLYCPARGLHVDDLLIILTTCCILHNKLIENREESSEGSVAGTRNILSFDEAAPPS
jgi:Plant transposon protein